MAKNWAITIGINHYDFLQPLKYAKRDAQLMQDFLKKQAECEKVFFFSDDSPSIRGKSTRPNRANLRGVLLDLCEKPWMNAGDNFWFFFSGHGMRHAGRDYLMPCDGNPRDIEHTGIEINFVIEQLRNCGADNIVLILDACRNEGEKSGEGIGKQTAKEARNTGVISFFSCEPNQLSYEIEQLEQGAFTCALLEGLTGKNPCVTVEKLDQYLCERVPQLNQEYNKPPQAPYTAIEPRAKNHLILLPQYATDENIATLKYDAYHAAQKGELELAKQLWIHVDGATFGKDIEAAKELKRIAQTNQLLFSKIAQHKNKLLGVTAFSMLSLVGSLIYQSTYVDLSSDLGVDYKPLKNLLDTHQWSKANEETLTKMLEVGERQNEGHFRKENFKYFPCTDLRTIDNLWKKYSHGHFGFSVQAEISNLLKQQGITGDSYWKELRVKLGWATINDLDKYGPNYSVKIFDGIPSYELSQRFQRGHVPMIPPGEEIATIYDRVERCNLSP